MSITELGYVGLTTTALPEWAAFARDVLDVEVRERGSDVLLKLDGQAYRVRLQAADRDELAAIGLRVDSESGLDELRETLGKAGVAVTDLDGDERAARQTGRSIRFADPAGYPIEAFVAIGHDLVRADGRPAAEPAGTRYTLGHVVLGTTSFEASLDFYCGLLGFRVTDLYDDRIAFLHCNRRHHTIALVGTDVGGLRHVMLEATSLVDLGRTYDRALSHGTITKYLGQHVNDEAVSYYCRPPAGAELEIGWNGLLIDPSTWAPRRIAGPISHWGHGRPGADGAAHPTPRMSRELGS